MRFLMTVPPLALVVALSPITVSLGAGNSAYIKDRLLTIPSINTADQVGRYQDVVFTLTEQGEWRLLSGKAIGSAIIGAPAVGLMPIEKVDVTKTDTFPVQVFLRVIGYFDSCNNASIGQINQRLENNKFDIAITYNYFVPASTPPTGCLASMETHMKTIPLSVYGLNAGAYSFNVNGTTGMFELTADNTLPGDY